MRKKKTLSVLMVPLLLSGCSGIVHPSVEGKMQINPLVRNLNTGLGKDVTLLGEGGSSSSNYQTTGYPSVYSYETHKCTKGSLVVGTITNIPSDYHGYHDCGVKIYASGTKTNIGSTSIIRLTATNPYIDFTEANWMMPQSYQSYNQADGVTKYLEEFRIEIVRNGYSYFHAGAKVNLDSAGEKIESVTYDKHTTKTTDTNCNKDVQQGEIIDFSKLGKIASSLYDGDYTIKLTYRYSWLYVEGALTAGIPNLCLMSTTATSEIPLIIDYTKPVLSLKKTVGGASVSNGGYVNGPVTISVSDAHPGRIYYKTPYSSSYSYVSSASYATGSISGWYSFYAEDANGNQSDTIKVYIDTIRPNGQIYVDGKAVDSGSYTNKSFNYHASDEESGVKACYYKTPNSNSFVPYSSGSIIPSDSGDGWYQFYSIDNAGNQSDTLKVFLETKAPVVKILRNGSCVFAHEIVESETIDTGLYFNSGDSIQFDYDSSSDIYTSGNFNIGRKYLLSQASYPNDSYSQSITSAVGITDTFRFKIVRKKPTLVVNGVTYQDGSEIRINKDADISMDIDSAINSGENKAVITEGDEEKTFDLLGTRETLLKAEENEIKHYGIEVHDAAGNKSAFNLVIDKMPAEGQFLSNGSIIPNGGYTNKPFVFSWSKEGTTATISKDGGANKSYANETISEDGRYAFVLTDSVGNTSEFSITLDSVAPIGRIYVDNKEAEDGAITNKSIYFTWDGDETCEVNGNPYKKNDVISQEGQYTFILKDKAGNMTTYTAEIDKTAPIGNEEKLENNPAYSASKWYEVSFKGSIIPFKDYDKALEKAVSLEREDSVKELILDDVDYFKETSMVASNGNPDNHDDEPRTGTYWFYKSIANPDISLYYFDENLLDEALRHYASAYVSGPCYLDGSNKATGENVTDSMFVYGGMEAPIGNGYSLESVEPSTAYAIKQGSEEEIELQYGIPLGEQLSEDGLYEITEMDRAGNSCSYQIIIDKSKPSIVVGMETYSSSSNDVTVGEDTIPVSGAYYLKSFSIQSIIDSDPYAVVSISHGGNKTYYSKGDELPTLHEGGRYDIRVYDRIGNEIAFTVYISSVEETVIFSNANEDKEVHIDISLTEKNQTITSLDIYRNGVKLSGVTPDNLSYVFDKDGNYKVVLKDNFGRVIEKEYRFVKAVPQGVLSGVQEGAKTKDDVSFTYDPDEYRLEVYKDGKLISSDDSGSYGIHSSVETSGSYELILINKTDEENRNSYCFTIDAVSPDVKLDGVEEGKTTNGSVRVSWDDEDVMSSTVSLNGGEPVDFANGDAFDKEGTYRIEVKDDLGNATIKEFTIDKTVDYEVVTSDGKTIFGDATTSSDVSINLKEAGDVTILKNGEKYSYSDGEYLTEEGRYLITVEDAFGNKTSFTIVIDKSVDFDIDVADGGISNGPVTINLNEKANIIMTKDGEAYGYNPGEQISEEGSYRAIITDSYGNEKEIHFQIVSAEARTDISFDLGDDVTITKVTKDGAEIFFDDNHIEFKEDGTYEVFYVYEGKEYSFALTLDTAAPEVTINGVEDGGTVDGSVTISDMTEEGTLKVYKDGTEIDYKLGDELSEYGSYKVVVTDRLGNSRTYSFTLAFQMNGWAIALIAIGAVSLIGAGAFIVFKRKRMFKK